MKKTIYFLFILLSPIFIFSQNKNTKKLSFSGDFRFRAEQDWDSQKSDGIYRNDRTRLRYRARFGVAYKYSDWISLGIRLRTGNPKKQQDPQLTVGDGFNEFGTLPISFEKIYAEFNYEWFSGWLGKNTFPFEKQHELFWSDNVFPEGISLSGKFAFNNNIIQSLKINTGHFIMRTNGTSLDSDGYFQGFQIVTTHLDKILLLNPSFYNFKNIPNIPDGNETFTMNYAIVHLGTKVQINKNSNISVGFDFYQNIEDYNNINTISQEYKNQKNGFVANISVGKLAKKGDWTFKLTHTYLEKYAAVDFFAQNDWARWDYSSQGSPDGRLTNFKGFELMAGYSLGKKMNLKIRCFKVDQIKSLTTVKENGNRIRIDFNIGF
ncbi:putative porin [Polaribacter sp. SA4-12]|uniref:putative porin n=1 Tax=Polaribacter sp. SA4-12 TaxID=1312072 RepID=UPI000B5500FC|nr:putative porin [Polaribacter sp. SA4-12]ARV15221.1 hypothetical protein BTO07_08710 [Polaribacter sp. SA4-12]